MAQQRETREALHPALLAVGLRDDVLAHRQQSGLFRAFDCPDRIVRVGVPGLADVGMIVSVVITPDMVGKTVGVAVQVEMKTAKGRQRDDQKSWEQAIRKRGGVYRLVRSEDDMNKLVEDVQRGRCF